MPAAVNAGITISQQNGVWVNSTNAAQRLVGTIRATSATTTSDSNANRLIYNANNRVVRGSVQGDSGNWSTNTTAWQVLDSGNAAWKHGVVVGLEEDFFDASAAIWVNINSNNASIAIFVDNTYTAPSIEEDSAGSLVVRTTQLLLPGYHAITVQSSQTNTNSVTWDGGSFAIFQTLFRS
jgi:hypothetical protein